MVAFRTAFRTHYCLKIVHPQPMLCWHTMPTWASPGTATSTVAFCSTNRAASSKATTSSACWLKHSWPRIRAPKLSTIRGLAGTLLMWFQAPVAYQCNAKPATRSSRSACAPRTRCTAAR